LFHDVLSVTRPREPGVFLRSNTAFSYADLLAETRGDRTKVEARRLAHILEGCGVTSGKVLVYGQCDAGKAYSMIEDAREYLPEIEFCADWDESVLYNAMITKDETELDQIRQMGKITTSVVGRVADFLSQQKVNKNELIDLNGNPVTIGQVKRLINLWLAEAARRIRKAISFTRGMILESRIPPVKTRPSVLVRPLCLIFFPVRSARIFL
jgi:Xaa-Pro aminopeptidase